MPSNLRIDPERLWATLMETAAIGGTAKGGINRQTLTAEDGKVRAWFKREAEALGCTVSVDEIGNMFALRPAGTRGSPRSRSAATSTRSRRGASSTATWACSARWRPCARWWRPATRPTRQSWW